jgi:tetratricopeptide (TPR) repeat protein
VQCALCLGLLALNQAPADFLPQAQVTVDETEWQASPTSWCGKAETAALQHLKHAKRDADDIALARYSIQLGDLARLQGKLKQAEAAYQRALRIAQGQLKNLAGDASAPIRLLVTARYAMGNFYRSQGDYLKAEKEFIESKGGGALLMPADDPSLARSAGALASVLASRGDLEQAHQLCTWAVDRVITYCGTNDAEIAWIDDMMGRSYAFAGHYAKALPVYKHMLTVRVAALPPEHPDLADAHNRLASVFHKIDRKDDAVEHLRQALAIRTKALGPDHPYTARSRKNMESAQRQHAAAP